MNINKNYAACAHNVIFELTFFVNITDHAQTRLVTIEHSPYLYFIHLIVGCGLLKNMIGATDHIYMLCAYRGSTVCADNPWVVPGPT